VNGANARLLAWIFTKQAKGGCITDEIHQKIKGTKRCRRRKEKIQALDAKSGNWIGTGPEVRLVAVRDFLFISFLALSPAKQWP